jgi:uncharacterized protein YjdB
MNNVMDFEYENHNPALVLNEFETGITPEDALKRSHNGMAVRKENDLIEWKKDEEIYDPAVLSSLSLVEGSELSLQIGDSKQLHLVANPAIANIPAVVWECSNLLVAEVNQGGLIFAKSEGEVTIKVTSVEDNSKTASLTLAIVEKIEKKDPGLEWSAESVTVTSASDQLPTLTNPNNLEVTYSSSVESVATINAEGEVTLVDGGETVITANFE